MMLQAINIHKTYSHAAKSLHVLRGINLTIDSGEVLSIVGPSGAGKSTLLHILGGLDKPSDGRVIFENQEIYGLNDKERANIRNRKIGFVFQFYHLLPEFSALENVMLPALIKNDMAHRQEVEEQGLKLLGKVGLKQRASHKPYQLSGGEQQRVAIARSLINMPDVIFCDEPTGNLDSKSGEEIIGLLKNLNEENKQTFVIVTHDDHIANISKKVLHMRDGQLL